VIGTRSAAAALVALSALTAVSSMSAVLVGCAHSTRRTTSAGTTSTTVLGDADGPVGTPKGVVEVAAGTCFNDVADPTRKPYLVMVVDCPSPHTYEAYDQIRYSPDGAGAKAYPGKDQMRSAAEDACFANFEAWMGVEWKRSDFDIATWWPSAESWAQNDRMILCAVYQAVGGKVTGSVQGSAR